MHSVSNDGIGYKYLENYFWASEIKIAMKRNTTNCVMLEKFQLQRKKGYKTEWNGCLNEKQSKV